ncbi:histidinol-phosphate transaminase [Clostridium massiliamazoniense]|uniref:histidinol-phosphate transaminase n=1 Tax=Clostridium massiliamazoniense TaxID=1347366 RepID=UPI0006D7F908|nr:histidinol-phosphate transaminase [Clostridium massiliamazoniense]
MGNKVREEIEGLNKYIGGKPISEVKREFNIDKVVKMASNENPLGCSDSVKDVLKNLVDNTALYPDGDNYYLRKSLSQFIGIDEENIILGAGSSSLIKVICNTLINKGEESIMGEITFVLYETFTKLMGGKAIKVPMKDLALDLDSILDSINERTKIIWLCNPNNPTGTAFTTKELEEFLEKVPKNVYVVIDEAYKEYVSMENYPDSLSLLKNYKNIIILRTFSKAYGLASLRVGYGICDEELAEYFNRVLNPFEVSLYAQNAAVEAIKDKEFVEYCYDYNKKQREFFYKAFKKLNLDYKESQSNFILVDVKGEDREINDYLLKNGYIIRPGYLLGCSGYLRISVGLEEDNKKLIELLNKYFREK